MSNRKIKFRAWMSDGFSEEEFRMYYHDEMGDGILTDAIEEVNENKYGTVLMQNTGLKDKNGVEIYEGDIMKYNEIGIVCFGEFESFHEGGCSRYHFHQGFYIVDRNNKQLRDKVNEDINWKQYKVIGNIYENKDLIK